MNCWITTRYPHPEPDTPPWHIYFRRVPRTLPKVGDVVLFYESEMPQADRNRLGRKGIVRAAIGRRVWPRSCTEDLGAIHA